MIIKTLYYFIIKDNWLKIFKNFRKKFKLKVGNLNKFIKEGILLQFLKLKYTKFL